MGTIALHKLFDYILSLSLTDTNKDWLASKIIESKSISSKENDEELFSMFGAWSNDSEIDIMEKSIKEGRESGVTRKIMSLDEV